jgi:hypothetical protein
VNQEELWYAATAAVRTEYDGLPPLFRLEISRLLGEIALLKESSADRFDAGAECAACQGACCRFGRHHFSVVDLLGHLVAGEDLFTPDFGNPVCPYHTGTGCIMKPRLRPFTCIIFICEQIEAGLDEPVKAELTAIETELRRKYAELERLLGNRFENGLLITYERSLLSGENIFRY